MRRAWNILYASEQRCMLRYARSVILMRLHRMRSEVLQKLCLIVNAATKIALLDACGERLKLLKCLNKG
jgi:hypothetical protein